MSSADLDFSLFSLLFLANFVSLLGLLYQLHTSKLCKLKFVESWLNRLFKRQLLNLASTGTPPITLFFGPVEIYRVIRKTVLKEECYISCLYAGWMGLNKFLCKIFIHEKNKKFANYVSKWADCSSRLFSLYFQFQYYAWIKLNKTLSNFWRGWVWPKSYVISGVGRA